jgi:hypothetical protein
MELHPHDHKMIAIVCQSNVKRGFPIRVLKMPENCLWVSENILWSYKALHCSFHALDANFRTESR